MPDGRKQYVDYAKCVVVFSRTLGCGVCIKECPFFKGGFEHIKKASENITSERTLPS